MVTSIVHSREARKSLPSPSTDFDDLGEEFEEDEWILQAGCEARSRTANAGPFKLVLIVNMQLKMGKGKVVAQCCHATLANYHLCKRYCPSALRRWEEMGQAKICVKCPTEAELYHIQLKARENGIINHLVMDAGHTQIAAGSRTVLALGPAPVEDFQGISSHLKLM